MTTAPATPPVTIYSLTTCGWSRKAKAYFEERGIPFYAIEYDMSGPDLQRKIGAEMQEHGAEGFPYVKIGAIGFAVLVTMVVVFALIMRSEALATRVGTIGQRLVDPLGRRIHRLADLDITRSVLDFRHHSIGLLRRNWFRITAWVILFNLIQYLLLLACVRSIGLDTHQLGWIEVFAAFAFARLLETIPITPSGVGFVETGAAATLIAGNAEAATAAVFLFRGFTYLLEIPTGALAWGVWASRRGWRRPIGSADR